jgi:hypothetical protein
MWRWLPILAAGCVGALAAPAIPELPHGQCENGATGADGYFLGHFTIADGKVTGTETWVLYANEAWKAKGGRDCSLTWNVTGATSPPGKCTGCTTSFKFHAVPDTAASNCPEELLRGRRAPTGEIVGGEASAFDQHYDVATGADGSAVVKFASSGREIGKGTIAGGTLDYTSHHQCKFF